MGRCNMKSSSAVEKMFIARIQRSMANIFQGYMSFTPTVNPKMREYLHEAWKFYQQVLHLSGSYIQSRNGESRNGSTSHQVYQGVQHYQLFPDAASSLGVDDSSLSSHTRIAITGYTSKLRTSRRRPVPSILSQLRRSPNSGTIMQKEKIRHSPTASSTILIHFNL